MLNTKRITNQKYLFLYIPLISRFALVSFNYKKADNDIVVVRLDAYGFMNIECKATFLHNRLNYYLLENELQTCEKKTYVRRKNIANLSWVMINVIKCKICGQIVRCS